MPSHAGTARRYIQAQLLLAALSITTQVLRKGGTFVAKIFRGRDSSLLYEQLRVFFPEVSVAKPKSSRNSSAEAFVVARGFTLPAGFARGTLSRITTAGPSMQQEAHSATSIEALRLERLIVPFVACGDLSGYDADANYSLHQEGATPYVYHEPAQKPTTPAYREYLEAKQQAVGAKVVLDQRTHTAQLSGGTADGAALVNAEPEESPVPPIPVPPLAAAQAEHPSSGT